MTTQQYQIKAGDDLKQSDLEKFDMELVGQPARLIMPSASKYGGYLRAAIGAGWIITPATSKRTVEENGKKTHEYLFDGVNVDDMKPALVWKVGREVELLYDKVTTIDPN